MSKSAQGSFNRNLQGGIVEGFHSLDLSEKDARIGGICRVQNILEIPLDGCRMRRGAIVDLMPLCRWKI
jgi:hypothetical protein